MKQTFFSANIVGALIRKPIFGRRNMLIEISIEKAKEIMPLVSELISETDRYAVSDVNGMIFQWNDQFKNWFFTGYKTLEF